MNRLAVAALRVMIVILFLAALSTQLWFIPQLAFKNARDFPELAYLAAPYAVLWVAIVVNAQVTLVAVWVLLGKVRRGAIFSPSSFRWVNGIIAAGAIATVLLTAFEFHLLGAEDLGGPPLGMLLTALVVVGAAFVLIMLVMRGLLLQATALQSELEEVV